MSDFIDTFNCGDLLVLSAIPSKNIIYKPINNKNMLKPEVYISYGWEEESEKVVKEICTVFDKKDIKYKLDKKDIEYKGSIKKFEESLGKGDFIVLVVSDKFLKSKDCMYEMLKIKQSGNMPSRILPIVLDSAKIRRPQDIFEYIKHWENETKELDSLLKEVSSANLDGLHKQISNYSEFRRIIDGIIELLRDMNTLNWSTHQENNYEELIKIIETQMEIKPLLRNDENDLEVTKIATRMINQNSKNAVYIEKNEGDIHFS